MGDTATSAAAASATRAALRSEGRARRRSVHGDDRRSREASLHAHLASIVVPPTAVVGMYVSDDGEPDLAGLAEHYFASSVPLALPVPANDADDFTMEFRPWRHDDELAPGRYGIPCPPPREAVVPALVLVPLVRFDANGNRMGRGAGFYDRWLGGHPETRSIGVAFEVQRADGLAPQTHDVAMHAIVSELGIRYVLPTGTR